MLGTTRASMEAPGLGLGDQYLWAAGWVGNAAQVSTLGGVWTGSHPAGGGDARLQDRRVVREAGRGGATGAVRNSRKEPGGRTPTFGKQRERRMDRLEVRTVSWKPVLRGWQMPEGRGLRHMEWGLGWGTIGRLHRQRGEGKGRFEQG